MDYNKNRIFEIIKHFAINQSNMTKAANTRRGATKKLIKEERRLVEYLLLAASIDYTQEEVTELIKSFA